MDLPAHEARCKTFGGLRRLPKHCLARTLDRDLWLKSLLLLFLPLQLANCVQMLASNVVNDKDSTFVGMGTCTSQILTNETAKVRYRLHR